MQCVAECCSALQRVAVCCSVLQCVSVCCNVMQCVVIILHPTHKRERARLRHHTPSHTLPHPHHTTTPTHPRTHSHSHRERARHRLHTPSHELSHPHHKSNSTTNLMSLSHAHSLAVVHCPPRAQALFHAQERETETHTPHSLAHTPTRTPHTHSRTQAHTHTLIQGESEKLTRHSHLDS